MPRLRRTAAALGNLLGATEARAADLLVKFARLLRVAVVDRTEEGRQRAARRRRRYTIAAAIIMIIPPGLFAWLWVWALHAVSLPSAAEITSSRVIALETADGQPLLPKRALQLPPVAVKDMQPVIVDAVLSVEDRRFFQRGPIDALAILRAPQQNFEAGHIVAGGSTIAQQLAKVRFLSPERTYKRKVEEAVLATWIELHLSKDQILTAYLNDVYLGSGAIGFPAAAKLYFDKKLSDLTLPEAAMLGGMINAPNEDDPRHDLLAARARASVVLDAMVANGKIGPEAALAAKLNPATPNPARLSPPSGGWFADWAYRKAAASIPALGGAVRERRPHPTPACPIPPPGVPTPLT
jgi:penicillin-binding protein 1A